MLWQTWYPNAVALDLGPLRLYWYGILIAVGLLLALNLITRTAPRFNIKKDDCYSLTTWLLIFGIIGARLYEVLVINFDYYRSDPLAAFRVWEGGLAIHGAIIAGVITLVIWNYKHRYSVWRLLDLAVVGLAFGQALGRWGNYFNQELFGRPTSGWWGIAIAPDNRPEAYLEATHFQPLFFYESFLNLLLGLILYRIVLRQARPGIAVAGYAIGYGIIRFGLEFLRIDDTPELLGLRLPQLVSLALIVFGIGLWVFKYLNLGIFKHRKV